MSKKRKDSGVPVSEISGPIPMISKRCNARMLAGQGLTRYVDFQTTKPNIPVFKCQQNGNWGLWACEVVRVPTELPMIIDKHSVAKWDTNDTIGMINQ